MLIRVLHRIKHRGVAMVEYAVLLAFIVSASAFFTPDNGISSRISSTIDKVFWFSKSFEEKYPKNLPAVYIEFAKAVAELNIRDGKDENGKDKKDYLNAIFNTFGNEQELKFTDLSAEQKAGLLRFGLNVDDFPNACFYKDEPKNLKPYDGRWYICWTGEDLSSKNGKEVKVIIYSFSDKNYYTGKNIYENGSFTNGCISYKYDDGSPDMNDLSDTYKKTNNYKTAQKNYDAL